MSKHEGSIRLSPRHGVNPSVMLCFFCQEPMGVALPGKLPGDEQAPREATWDHEPCDKCRDWMKEGVVLISVREWRGRVRWVGFCSMECRRRYWVARREYQLIVAANDPFRRKGVTHE